MNQHVENGRTITICPHCHSDVSGCVLIVYYVVADGGEPCVWRCPRCEGEWPRQPPRPPQRPEVVEDGHRGRNATHNLQGLARTRFLPTAPS